MLKVCKEMKDWEEGREERKKERKKERGIVWWLVKSYAGCDWV